MTYNKKQSKQLTSINSKLSFRFTTKGVTTYKGHLCVECRIVGTTKRKYMKIAQYLPYQEVLDAFNDEKGKFVGTNFKAKCNNEELNSILSELHKIATELSTEDAPSIFKEFASLRAVRSMSDEGEEPSGMPTFGQWVNQVIKAEQNKSKGGSTNHELYKTLYSKLCGVDKEHLITFSRPTHNGIPIGDVKLDALTVAHFKSFGQWVINEFNGAGYKNLMTNFQSAFNKAVETFGLQNTIAFKWRAEKPNYDGEIDDDDLVADTLTTEDIQKLIHFDMSTIRRKCYGGISFDLTRDFVLLQYYTLSRPADVLLMRMGKGLSIHSHDYMPTTKKFYYFPYKLRGRNVKSHTVVSCDNPLCQQIIEKYKGISEAGYILPLPMLHTDWGKVSSMDGKAHRDFERKKKPTLNCINKNLKIIAESAGLSITALTPYVFRHSAITHAIVEHNVNPMVVAKLSGTSLDMIQKHYMQKDCSSSTPMLGLGA